jgi:amino acid adenylation domain-containing protein
VSTHSLPHVLRNAAANFPHHEAVRFRGQALTWESLWRRTCLLASILQRSGVVRGDRVAFYMHKSPEAVIAIYAIMKAGAAYVPLDPFAPLDRLRKIAADSRLRCLLTQRNRLEQARSLGGTEPIAPWDELDPAMDSTREEILAGPNDAAYILYTSGSTGTPKGIVHTHSSAMAFAAWAADEFSLSPADRLSSHAPFHFDLSTFDLFSAALAGSTTVLVPDALTKFPAAMVRFIRDERISVWYSVPYAWIQMLEHGNLEGAAIDSLRWILFAGEPFPPKHLRRLMTVVAAHFANLYGPTETNVCTWHHVDHHLEDNAPIPIGKPCPGTEAMVLDGELLISGPTVMRGYQERQDLDQRCLVTFNGRRFYRTGDLVKQDSCGEYHYLGRKDRQIKVRGYRVELDEVEAALLTHPDVKEAIVYAVPDGSGSNRIEAIVNKANEGLTLEDLEQHASSALPVYSIPSAIRFETELPRTSTGKIDRRAIELHRLATLGRTMT